MESCSRIADAVDMTSAAQTRDTGVHAQHSLPADVGPVWPRHCKTHDGGEYRIRPIQADDAGRDRSFLRHLSTESRYNRMMGLSRDLAPDLLSRLVHVDYRREMALVALVNEGDAETIIGVARYGGNPAYCEFAIAVADEWQSRGVGTTLARLLFDYAKTHGVRRMYALIFANNARMLKLAGDLQMTLRRSRDDDSIVEAWRTL